MGTPEEAREYAAMDHSEANASFVEALARHGCNKGELLDIGTGPADIPLLLVASHPHAHVTATDLSAEMLKIARLNVAHAGQSRRIRLMEADAKGLPFASRHFDGVFSNTILHHVSDPVAFFKEAVRVLKPTGALVVRDLARPQTLAQVRALVRTYAGDATEFQRKLLHDSLRAAYTVEETRSLLDEAGVRGARVEMTSDRHFTVWIDAR